MKRFFLSLIICTISIATIFAQNDAKALDVLNNASTAYFKAGGVKAGFSISVLGYGGKITNKLDGNICLKGSKFKLEVDEMITWFDGKNQWVYLKNNNEVNLSNPSEEEQLMINPVKVFQLYKHGYNCKWIGQNSESGKTTLKVSLIPKDKNGTVQNIIASFDKTSYRPVSIIITNKDKSGSRISIPAYLTGQKYQDAQFVFQQKSYPNTEVIDLR